MGSRLRLMTSEAWNSLGANASTTVAATLTVLIGMFLLGLFVALGTWTVSWSNHVKSQLVVRVDFSRTATPLQMSGYARGLHQNPYVKAHGIAYVSKEEGLRIMARRYPDYVAGLPSNPLPDVLKLTPNRPENVDKLFDSISGDRKAPFVEKVTDGRKLSHRILQVAQVIEIVFTLATLVLLIASTLLISNTIRLSIFSRRREIEVMKLVGATNWFVRAPFMLEGLFCGIAGSLLAIFLLAVGKAVALPAILPRLSGDSDVHGLAFPLVALMLLGAGLAIGALGSALTIRRFLQV